MTNVLANLVALLVMPFWLTGVVNRVKSRWSGRRGPPLFQLAFDVRRLLAKSSVYSATTTPLFRIAPYLYLATAVATALIAPIAGTAPLCSFPFDFVWLAYVWGLGRIALALAAMDTGGAFAGMGAAREMTFAVTLEPVLFLVTGALALLTHGVTLHDVLAPRLSGAGAVVVWAACVLALFIVLQVEAARMPVDDPSTHLELTMVHEAMVLDHSGPDLAAIHVGTAVKLVIGSAVLARLLNPWAVTGGVRGAVAGFALCTGLAVSIGTTESLVARLRLRAVPGYIAIALGAGLVALGAAALCRGATA